MIGSVNTPGVDRAEFNRVAQLAKDAKRAVDEAPSMVPATAERDGYMTKEYAEKLDNFGGLSRQNSTQYAVGDIAFSAALPSNLVLECTTAGTTAATEPDFSGATIGGTVSDGAAVWTYMPLGTLSREVTPGVNSATRITTSQTYTAPVTGWYTITIKGGGGGGAGGAKNTAYARGGAGGGEGATQIIYRRFNAGTNVDVVIGAGGAGGAGNTSSTSSASGAAGGASSVTSGGSTVSANGGSGGVGQGGAGGTGGRYPGACGGSATVLSTGAVYGMPGGGSGGGEGGSDSANGGNGAYGGGGGGGGASVSGTARAGGNGGNGFVIFEYFAEL